MNNKKAPKELIITVIVFAILIIISFVQFFPFYLKLVTSFQGRDFIPIYDKLYLFPEGFNFANYVEAWKRADLLKGFFISIIHSGSIVILTTFIAFIFGYVLGKIRFRGRKIVYLLIISTLMVPGEVLMIPNYLLVQKIGWYNNLAGIIFPGLVNVLGIFLFKQFMDTVPDSILESADLDGAGELRKIFMIAMPLCVPVILTYVTLTFTAAWNDYVWPMTILQDTAIHTLQLRMYKFYPRFTAAYVDGYIQAAGEILVSVPIILLFLFNQKYYLQSVSVTGIK